MAKALSEAPEDFRPLMEHVVSCMFSSWYRDFKHLTIKSAIIPLPTEFIQYLNADGIVLPSGIHHCMASQTVKPKDDSWDWETDEEASQGSELEVPQFPDLDIRIQQAIDCLGGVVFPKLNWSSPLDAKWISPSNTLQCQKPVDIYLLLKSSNRVAHDLDEAFKNCSDYDGSNEPPTGFQLVLRKWKDIVPGMEFRCFVRDDHLIAVCQRDYTAFYNYLVVHQDELITEIEEYFQEYILCKFPLKHYVFDIYRKHQGSYLLIDFNPFDSVTEPLLFTWEELTNIPISEPSEDQHAMFQFVTSDAGIQPSKDAYSRLPIDIVDLSTGKDISKFVDLFKKGTWEDQGSSDDEDRS